MKINKTNYEAYLIDYFDGNRSTELESALRAFVLAHPELEIDLDGDLLSLNSERRVFDDKLSLKRSEVFPDLAIEELILKNLEGEATEEERGALSKLCAENDEVAQERERLVKCYLKGASLPFPFKENLLDTSLQPLTATDYAWAELHEGDRVPNKGEDLKERLVLGIPSMSYPNKAALIQKERGFGVWWRFGAAAAVLILAVFLIPRNDESTTALRLANIPLAKSIDLPLAPALSNMNAVPTMLSATSSTKQSSPKFIQSEPDREKQSTPSMMETLAFEWKDLQAGFDQQLQHFNVSDAGINQNQEKQELTLAQNEPKRDEDGGFLNLREFLGQRLKQRLDLPANSGTNETVMALASQARQSVKRKSQGQSALLKNKKTDKFKTLSLQIGRFSYERK